MPLDDPGLLLNDPCGMTAGNEVASRELTAE